MEYRSTLTTTALGLGTTLATATLGVLLSTYSVSNLLSPTRQESLKVIHEEKSPGQVVDIVYVHGVEGDSDRTSSSRSSPGRKNWLVDILPADLRERDVYTRVMTYDYPVERKPSSSFPAFLRRHARRLAKQLWTKREGKVRDRPLIFIGHSLGGLIVRAALVYASASDMDGSKSLKILQQSTVGVLYFGTPCRDGQNLQWSQMLDRIMQIDGGQLPLPGIDSLLWQDELFKLELDRYKSIEYQFRNVSFYESKPTTIIGQNARVVAVPKDLTIPVRNRELWESHSLNRDHRDLCKFESNSDPDYKVVVKALHGCLDADSAPQSQPVKKSDITDDDDESCVTQIWRAESILTRAVIDDSPAARTKMRYLEEKVNSPTFLSSRFETDLQHGLELVDLYEDSREHDKSGNLFRRLKKAIKDRLDSVEAKYGYRDHRSLRLAAGLARLYATAGDHSKSESLNRGLYVIIQDLYTENSLQFAFILNQLAHDAHAHREHDKAVNLLRRVIQIQGEHYRRGDCHPETLRTHARLAIMLDQQGKYGEAQEIYQRVIQCRTADPLMGPDHPETLKAMENLALSYRLDGRTSLNSAVDLYRKVLDGRRKALRRFAPSGLVHPELKIMADEHMCLYDETMTKMIEVVKQQKDPQRVRDLEDEWLEVKRVNAVKPVFLGRSISDRGPEKSSARMHGGSDDDQLSSSGENRVSPQRIDTASDDVIGPFSRGRSYSNVTASTDGSLQGAGSWIQSPATDTGHKSDNQGDLRM